MTQTQAPILLTAADLLTPGQGHHRLTRRVTETFPEDRQPTFMPASSLRPFGKTPWISHAATRVTGDWSATPPDFWER